MSIITTLHHCCRNYGVSLIDFVSRFIDCDLYEAEDCDVELSLEIMPSIEDIPLPPLEDLVPNSLDFCSSLS